MIVLSDTQIFATKKISNLPMVSGTLPQWIQEPSHFSKWFSHAYRIQEPCHIEGKSLFDNR